MNNAQEGKLEQKPGPATKESPSDKIEGDRRLGSQTPGAQNPESEEIKAEVNPNTE